jgi:hypothetical protein
VGDGLGSPSERFGTHGLLSNSSSAPCSPTCRAGFAHKEHHWKVQVHIQVAATGTLFRQTSRARKGNFG